MAVGTRKDKVMAPKRAYPGLWEHPKTGIYWFRLVIPKDLQKALGKKVVLKTLRTRDPNLAVEEWGPINTEWRGRIRAARSGDPRTISDEVAFDIAADITSGEALLFKNRHEIFDFIDEHFAKPFDIDGVTIDPDKITAADRQKILEGVEEIYLGLTAFAVADLKAQAENFQDQAKQTDEMVSGYVVASPEAAQVHAQHSEGKRKLRDAYVLWKSATEPSSKTASEFEKAVEEFIGRNGNLALSEITGEHFRTYRAHLREAISRKGIPLSKASRHKRFAGVKAIIAKAVDEGWIDTHPGFGVNIERGEESSYRQTGWLDEELKLLFSSPVYSEGYRPETGGEEAAYWLPVLEIFTGARESELAQLNVADVYQVDGIWCVEFKSSIKTNQRVKNKSSERVIPLHSKIIELGFLRYIRTVDPNGRIFPSVHPDSHGQAGGLWSRWFSRYRKKIGLTRDAADFHALRHVVITKLRDSDKGSDVTKDKITGHSSGKVGAGYGTSSKAAMKVIIEQINFRVAIPKWKAGKVSKAL